MSGAETTSSAETNCPSCGTPFIENVCRRCAFAQALLGLNGAADAAGSPMASVAGAPEGFELLYEIGRGSSAVVWLAREQKLDRFVALKLIAASADSRLAQRLVREGQAIGRLNHPNIVAVHALGANAQ